MWNRTEDKIKTIKCIFIRHGSTASNREHRYLGKTDELLDEAGVQQIKQAAGSGIYDNMCTRSETEISDKTVYQSDANTQNIKIYSSPLCRCIQTAKIIFPDAEPEPVEGFSEMDFGEFELKNYEELSSDMRYRDTYQAWIDSGGTLAFPGGESRDEFIKRCVSSFEQTISALEDNDTAVFVVHGGTIMAIMSHYCGGDYFDYQVKNGCGYSCVIYIDYNNNEKKNFSNIKQIII